MHREISQKSGMKEPRH